MADVITHCYDLNASPVTHDFVNFLARAEYSRRAQGASAMDICFVPGDRQYSLRDKFYTSERKLWRVDDLLVPMARLVPSVRNVTFGPGRQELSYANPGRPVPPIFEAPPLARQVVKKLFPDNTVTITLRQSDFEPSRNSNQFELELIAEWLDANGFFPVFIPDPEADMRGAHKPTGYTEYLAASYNLALRLALWERAKLNLFTNGGSMVMALYSNVPVMSFKMYVADVACCQKAHLEASGFSPRHDWSTSTHRKHLYWEPETEIFVTGQLSKWLLGEVQPRASLPRVCPG